MITVAGRGMMGVPGIAARTFGSVARERGQCADDQPEQLRAEHLFCGAR